MGCVLGVVQQWSYQELLVAYAGFLDVSELEQVVEEVNSSGVLRYG